jgi:hypothetical protein
MNHKYCKEKELVKKETICYLFEYIEFIDYKINF